MAEFLGRGLGLLLKIIFRQFFHVGNATTANGIGGAQGRADLLAGAILRQRHPLKRQHAHVTQRRF
jgi:hypothetical protein